MYLIKPLGKLAWDCLEAGGRGMEHFWTWLNLAYPMGTDSWVRVSNEVTQLGSLSLSNEEIRSMLVKFLDATPLIAIANGLKSMWEDWWLRSSQWSEWSKEQDLMAGRFMVDKWWLPALVSNRPGRYCSGSDSTAIAFSLSFTCSTDILQTLPSFSDGASQTSKK